MQKAVKSLGKPAISPAKPLHMRKNCDKIFRVRNEESHERGIIAPLMRVQEE